MMRTHLLIGLTGGIGSGKSTVADLFAQRGVRIVDTDLISHQLTASGGAAIQSIREQFGDDFIQADGALNRTKMRQYIFGSAKEKQKLEALLHPLILNSAKQAVAMPTMAPYSLLVVPLLFEVKNYQSWLAKTLLVDCPESMQIQRTMLRSGLTEAAVRAIMAQQMDRVDRLQLADNVIVNDGELAALTEQVERQHQAYLALISGND